TFPATAAKSCALVSWSADGASARAVPARGNAAATNPTNASEMGTRMVFSLNFFESQPTDRKPVPAGSLWVDSEAEESVSGDVQQSTESCRSCPSGFGQFDHDPFHGSEVA